MRITGTSQAAGRTQTRGEERANTISHGVGLLGAFAALPVLVIAAVRNGDAYAVVGGVVFALSAVTLYLVSTVYHALEPGRAKRIFRAMDHAAIYILIAGSYTPFTLGILRGAWGWTLFGLVWGLALLGVVIKVFRPERLDVWLYILMGWLVMLAAKPLWDLMPAWGLFWLVAGGVFYTGGVAFFALDRKRYFHFVWHLFVLAGTSCHFVAVLWFAA